MRIRRVLADRVYYGWVIAIACLLASMAVFGTTYAFGVFYDSFVAEFAVSRTALAAVFGVQTALIYVGSIAAGRAIDRIGARRVSAGSGLLMAGGLAWTAFARSFTEIAVSFGVVTALGMAGLYVVGYATVPVWFGRRRGAAAGFASAGLGIGLVVIPPGADYLIAAIGWRGAMLVVAAAAAGLSTIVTLLFADDPAEVGADSSVEFAEEASSLGQTESVADDTSESIPSVRDIVLSAPFILSFVGWIFVFSPLYAVMSHIVVHATETGIGRSTCVLAITFIGATTTVSRIGVGSLSDRVGRTRTFVACAAVMGGSVVVLAGAPTAAALLGVTVAFGIGYGGCGGLFGALIADLFGDAHLNTLFGLLSLPFAVSGLLSPPLAGYLFEVTGSYEVAFVGLGLLGIVGAGCVALAGWLS